MTTVTPLPPLPRTPAGAPPRRTPAQRRLTGAAALTVLCLAVAALWVCYVLVHLDAPGVAAPGTSSPSCSTRCPPPARACCCTPTVREIHSVG